MIMRPDSPYGVAARRRRPTDRLLRPRVVPPPVVGVSASHHRARPDGPHLTALRQPHDR